MSNILKLNHLTKVYKKFKLNDLSFSIEKGTINGFIGENGAGKTTTMKMIAGIVIPTSGEILFNGKNIKDLSALERQKISITFDEPVFPEKIRIRSLETILKGLLQEWNRHQFYSYLNAFDVDKNKMIRDLSKGMKTKLNLAIALSHKAELLILDEPTNGLDPVSRDEVLGILVNFVKEGGSVLISSHILSDLNKIASKFIFLHNGNLLSEVTKEEIKAKYDFIETEDPSALLSITPESIYLSRIDSLTGKKQFLLYKHSLDGANLPLRDPTIEEYGLLLMSKNLQSTK